MSPVDGEDIAPVQQKENRSAWKRWQIVLSIVLLGLLLYFFWPLLGEIKAAANLFRTAEWFWLLVAILVQVCREAANGDRIDVNQRVLGGVYVAVAIYRRGNL